MLHFVHLPAFAGYLLHHIDDYTTEVVRLFHETNLPLLQALQHLSEEEKFQFSKRLNIEFLPTFIKIMPPGTLRQSPPAGSPTPSKM
jgi:hypothetical protein